MTTALDPATVAVIGGGISGLVAAHRVAQRGHRVVLLEAAGRAGGKVLTEKLDGITIEAGPDSFLAREPWAVDLCKEVGLADQLVEPAIFGAQVWTPSGLRRLPPEFPFGLPSSPVAAMRSRVLSPLGALRASADLLTPGPLTGPDVSIGSFVRRRFGTEVLDRLVDPLVAGTRAGRADDVSLAAAAPQIDAMARSNRSVIMALRSARRRGSLGAGPPPFLALRGGMQKLVDRLVEELHGHGEVRTSTPVEELRRRPDGSYFVGLPFGDSIKADAVVIATPAYAAARLLKTLNPVAAAELRQISYASVVSIILVYDSTRHTWLEGSGMLVPSSANKTLAACSWYSKKWPHHAADGRLVIRCFVGRAAQEAATELPDEDLVAIVTRELDDAIGPPDRLLRSRVTRWDRGLPQYSVGHLDQVRRIEKALETTPGIALAGAAYRGSGLPDCIKTGDEAAQLVHTWVDHRS